MTVPGGSPLLYPPGSQPSIKRIVRARAPTTNDSKNVRQGDEWLDSNSSDWYKLADITGSVATWVRIGGTPGDLQTLTTPDSTVVTPTSGNINFLNGTGINVTGSGSNITFNSTGTVSWSVETGTSANLVVNTGVFSNNGAGVAFTLPTIAALGDSLEIASINAGGWTVAQNAGQDIRVGNQVTTTGVGGSLASLAIGDTIQMICSVANTSFVVAHMLGNITVT